MNSDAARIERIILSNYCSETERNNPIQISWTNEIANVVIDLMHLAAARGVDWGQMMDYARHRYAAETDGQPPESSAI